MMGRVGTNLALRHRHHLSASFALHLLQNDSGVFGTSGTTALMNTRNWFRNFEQAITLSHGFANGAHPSAVSSWISSKLTCSLFHYQTGVYKKNTSDGFFWLLWISQVHYLRIYLTWWFTSWCVTRGRNMFVEISCVNSARTWRGHLLKGTSPSLFAIPSTLFTINPHTHRCSLGKLENGK